MLFTGGKPNIRKQFEHEKIPCPKLEKTQCFQTNTRKSKVKGIVGNKEVNL